MIKVAITDDHQMIIDGLRLLVNNFKDIQVVGQAKSLGELWSLLNKKNVDVLILDIKIGNENSIEELSRLKKHHPNLKIILFSSYNFPSLVKKAKELMVSGYLLKDTEAMELIEAIRTVARGEEYIGKSVNKSILKTADELEFEEQDGFLKRFNLSAREIEVIQLVVRGLESVQISEELFLSLNTVKSHRKRIFRKVGVANSTELVKFALENGLVDSAT